MLNIPTKCACGHQIDVPLSLEKGAPHEETTCEECGWAVSAAVYIVSRPPVGGSIAKALESMD